ncbi:hypothetical protein BG015_009376 [Linnemannia schmuckeri]|uniref:Uncharacterized protein n=1 Tax=Linnemannia schmuckeri TaxID=64567 RepID=A0A9P5RYC2_9FUNG|nr:hypothetical protein BG015_009376 [Linnemannia schmuckeri]
MVTQQQQQPEHQVSAAAGQQGIHQPLTFSQRMHHILDTAQDVLTRMKQQQGQKKEQDASAGDAKTEGQKEDCGSVGACTCSSKTKSAAAVQPKHQPAAA